MKRNKDVVPTSMLPKGSTRVYDPELGQRVWLYKGKKYISKRALIGSLTSNIVSEVVPDLPESEEDKTITAVYPINMEIMPEDIDIVQTIIKQDMADALTNDSLKEIEK